LSSRPRRLVLAVALIPSIVACGTGGPTAGASGATDVAVGVSEGGCAPGTVQAAAGPVRFVVTNAGADTGEFEIIGPDQRVIDEAENIVPGFVVNLSTRLDGGTYELVCGTLSSPRGVLTVSGGAAATAPPSTVVDPTVLAATVAEYKTYVLGQADDLVSQIETFTAAVDSGDLEAAKAAYGPARVPWERIEPIAELFADIDPKVDAREDDFEAGADDPAFTGYHRIEKGLWVDGTTDGLAELTATLRADIADLRTRLDTLQIDPRVMARGAGELIDEVAQSKMTGEEDRYSKLDLWSIQPNVEGSAKIVDLLRPIIAGIDAEYLAGLDGSYEAVDAIIAKYGSQASGFKTFDQIEAADLKALQAGLADLSERLAELPGRLGLQA
jgi:iron uptake system component EfeO